MGGRGAMAGGGFGRDGGGFGRGSGEMGSAGESGGGGTEKGPSSSHHCSQTYNLIIDSRSRSNPRNAGNFAATSHKDRFNSLKLNAVEIHDWLQPDSVHQAPQPESELLAQ